jgi:hypothetical protein
LQQNELQFQQQLNAAAVEMAARHENALTGAITIDIHARILYLDSVEVIWITDTTRQAELGITREDFTRVYYLHHFDPLQTLRFPIAENAEFVFTDSAFNFETDRPDRRIYTTDFYDFIRHIHPFFGMGGAPPLSPEIDIAYPRTTTIGRIVHFVQVNENGEVTRITQEFVFTQ